MKKLQDDLTTIEQSNRLLELGVPKNSANHYYGKDGKLHYIDGTIPYSLLWETGCIPCWSVGRLIEIVCKCWNGDRRVILFPNIGIQSNNIMKYVFRHTESDIQLGCLDFSKLEE